MKRKLLALLLTAGVVPLQVSEAARPAPRKLRPYQELVLVGVGAAFGWLAHSIVDDSHLDQPASPFKP